jgi:hypothetical protein
MDQVRQTAGAYNGKAQAAITKTLSFCPGNIEFGEAISPLSRTSIAAQATGTATP